MILFVHPHQKEELAFDLLTALAIFTLIVFAVFLFLPEIQEQFAVRQPLIVSSAQKISIDFSIFEKPQVKALQPFGGNVAENQNVSTY